MGIYQGRHAELYDLFYAEKPYAAEVAFIHETLQRLSLDRPSDYWMSRVALVSHAIELEKHGYDVMATDISEDMLASARGKARELSSRVRFERQDMRLLDLPETKFDGALCLFDAIGHVLTNTGIKQTFSSVRRHLRPKGLFILEFWHAAAIVYQYEPLRVRRLRTTLGEVLRLSETTLDIAQQSARQLRSTPFTSTVTMGPSAAQQQSKNKSIDFSRCRKCASFWMRPVSILRVPFLDFHVTKR